MARAQYKGGEAYSCVSTRLPDCFGCILAACALQRADQRRCACSGVQIKTRKRNIAVALDPGSFSDAVVTIFEDARVDGDNLEQGLQGGVKVCGRLEAFYSPAQAVLVLLLAEGHPRIPRSLKRALPPVGALCWRELWPDISSLDLLGLQFVGNWSCTAAVVTGLVFQATAR